MMKASIYPLILAAAILALVASPANSQNSSGGAQRVLSDERKILDDCESPNRPRPKGEIKVVSELRGKAIRKPKPIYPKEAKAIKVSGTVKVDVVIDEKGRVIWAGAVTGKPMLQEASRRAACRARYSPTVISTGVVKTQTSIRYNFVLP